MKQNIERDVIGLPMCICEGCMEIGVFLLWATIIFSIFALIDGNNTDGLCALLANYSFIGTIVTFLVLAIHLFISLIIMGIQTFLELTVRKRKR